MPFETQTRFLDARGKPQADSRIRFAIISPLTDRPMVKDLLGPSVFRELKRMLEKDERLSGETRFAVFFRVMKRKHEIETGSKTLGDVAAEEADRLLQKKRAN